MKHEYRRAALAWLSAASLLLVLSFASSASADDRARQVDRRLQPILQQLDSAARDARAQASEAAHRGGDKDLANRMSDFAKNVASVRERVEDHHLSDEKLRHDLRDLDDQSRRIQRDLLDHRNIDPMISDRWARVTRLMDDLNSEYRVAMGLQPAPRATSGDWRDQPPMTDRDRDIDRDRAGRREPAASGDLRNLARDLSDRASRLADRRDAGEVLPALVQFRDEAREFDRRLRDNPSLMAPDVRAEIDRLARLAADAGTDLDRRNAPDWVRTEWEAVVADAQRLQDMSAGGMAGTAGEEYGYAVDRGPVNGVRSLGYSDLAADLDRRVHHASTVADQLNIGDAAEAVSRVAQHVSRFARDVDTASPEDRRGRAKSLLDEARDVQRSLTKHNATPELIDEWNAVVDDLSLLAGSGR